MRASLSLGAVVAVALFGLSSAIAAPAAAPLGDAAKGKAHFERVGCWECHGHQGQGGNAGVRIADPIPLAWPAFLAWVRTTSGDMPPFTEKVLPTQDLADIFAYLQAVPKAPDYHNIPLLAQQISAPAR
jgi:mono/diheme cytochrome c family protein